MLSLTGTIDLRSKIINVLGILFICIINMIPSDSHTQEIMMVGETVKLYWTAPGDDYNYGRAARYDIRHSSQPIESDTVVWWGLAASVEETPQPSPAGRRDSCVVYGLSIDQEHYFAIRTADEALNWSSLSNVAVMPKISCADVNGDGAVNILDVVYLVNFVYDEEAPPPVDNSGDVDNTGGINVIDIIYLINFGFKHGPAPVCHD